MVQRYRIQFPRGDVDDLPQDETFFYLLEPEGKRKIRFHDYGEIYKMPGLYEQLFYERLKCQSPNKVTSILKSSVAQSQDSNFSELRVLDLGAGNGMMGECLKKEGVSRLVGVDIIPEAYDATVRDRPFVYDAYYTYDFCNLNEEKRDEMASWAFNCLTCVAALGFGDIPTKAFIEAFNMLNKNGWVGFNIKETFLDKSDETGFSKTIRELIFSEYLDIFILERYRHRFSIEGEELYYFAMAGWKSGDLPPHFIESIDQV